MFLIKKFEILIIGLSGWFAGITLSQFNERLQTLILLLTAAGIIWKMIKPSKK